MKKMILFFGLISTFFPAFSQLLSWTQEFPVDNSAITIVFDASKGNQGLNNYAGDVYIHTGVITNLSTGAGDWKYTATTWNSNNAAHKMTPLGSNKYQYVISNIRTFYGVPTNEVIRRLAMVFRSYNPTGSPLEGKCADLSENQGNMYIPINGLTDTLIRINQPYFEPRFTLYREPINTTVGNPVAFKGVASKAGNLTVYYNGTSVAIANAATSITANPVITAAGNQVLRMEAVYPDRTLKDSVVFYIAPTTPVAALPAGVREGINYEPGDTSVTLVFYAPQKTDVVVIGDFNNWVAQTAYQMNRTPDGNYYWKRITGLTPGTEYAYQYLIDGNLRIADPYTQKVLDPSPFGDAQIDVVTYPNLKPYPFGKTTQIAGVLQTQEPQYNWQVTNFTRPDKKHLIVYEALVRDFVGAHNWQAMIDTLGYLKKLNINAVELMPFSEFENNDSWGYNPTFFMAPDKYYGTKNKLKEYIDKCHQNGIAVIMDIVFNHEFGQGPHARMYWNPTLNRPAPNNPWLNETDKHPFGVGYDFNHESPATKYYVQRTLEHWINEYKIDGFRFDLSKGFTQNLTNNVGAWSTYDASRIAIWKRYADSIWTRSPNTYMILEHFAETAEDKELANYGFLPWGNMTNPYNEATMGYNTNSNVSGIVYNSSERQMNFPHSMGYMESHDEQRLMYKNLTFGNSSGSYNTRDTTTGLRRIEAAAALFFTIPGPKMIWQLGELGYDVSINACSNGSFPNNDPNNDACRTARKPFRWEYYQDVRRKRLYDVFASLINLRRTQVPAFSSSNMNYNLVGAVKWFQLTDPSLSLTVMGNFDVVPQSLNISFQNAGTWYDYLTGATFSATGATQSISLQPGEYHVYVNKNVTGVVTTPVNEIPNERNGLGLRVFPNPTATGSAVLKYIVPANGRITLTLVNIMGQPLQTLFAGTRAKGEYQLPIGNNLVPLARGTYFIRAEQNGKSHFTQFIR